MKKLLLGLICLMSFNLHAANDCRDTFASYKTKHLAQRNPVIPFIGPLSIGGVGALVANPYRSAAAAGWQAFFAPYVIYVGIEAGIAFSNTPYIKAINLINQSYAYRTHKFNKKTRLLKRVSRKLNLTADDLAETIISANEDGSLCKNNKSKRDIMRDIINKELRVINVDEETYGGRQVKWTCRAYPKVNMDSDYTRVDASYYGENNKRRLAQRNAKLTCSDQTGSSCEIYTCLNNFTGEGVAYGGAMPF